MLIWSMRSGVHRSNRPGDRAGVNPFGEHFPLFPQEQLGIPEAANAVRRIKDHRGGDNASEQGIHGQLIHARNQLCA